jgi:ribosomal protein L37AE/L43A
MSNFIKGELKMGFFDKKVTCAVCQKEIGLNRFRIADKQWICPKCYKMAGLKLTDSTSKMNVDDIKARMKAKEENQKQLDAFNPTKKIGSFMEFDDNQKKWVVLSGILGKRNKSTVYNYSDIVDFELLEDGESIAKGGLGRALVGGALFGGTGAIVGGITGKRKQKGICNSLKIKITVKDINNPVIYVNFITSSTKKDGMIYKSMIKDAQECLSTLQVICDQQKQQDNKSSGTNADEIRKYKELLDDGIITKEEFEAKKKELLNI